MRRSRFNFTGAVSSRFLQLSLIVPSLIVCEGVHSCSSMLCILPANVSCIEDIRLCKWTLNPLLVIVLCWHCTGLRVISGHGLAGRKETPEPE